jgi:acetyltransferase-like isoleucine patch superfamily enzyme
MRSDWLPGLPRATTLRVPLCWWRGVKVRKRVWIGHDAVPATSRPQFVTIGDDAVIGMLATLIAHFKEVSAFTAGSRSSIGPRAIIMSSIITPV